MTDFGHRHLAAGFLTSKNMVKHNDMRTIKDDDQIINDMIKNKIDFILRTTGDLSVLADIYPKQCGHLKKKPQ